MHGCKTCLGKFQKIKIISSIFSNTMRLEINCKGKKKKQLQKQGHMELNNMLLNSQWTMEETKEEIKNYLQTKMKTE